MRIVCRCDGKTIDALGKQLINHFQLVCDIKTYAGADDDLCTKGCHIVGGIFNAGPKLMHERSLGCLGDNTDFHGMVGHCQCLSGAVGLIAQLLGDFLDSFGNLWLDPSAIVESTVNGTARNAGKLCNLFQCDSHDNIPRFVVGMTAHPVCNVHAKRLKKQFYGIYFPAGRSTGSTGETEVYRRGTSQALCEKYDFHLGTAQPEKNTHQEQPAAEMVWETVGTAANDTVCLWKTQTGTSCKMEKSIPVLRLYRQFCGVKNEKFCA